MIDEDEDEDEDERAERERAERRDVEGATEARGKRGAVGQGTSGGAIERFREASEVAGAD